jgi:hypothetical protein
VQFSDPSRRLNRDGVHGDTAELAQWPHQFLAVHRIAAVDRLDSSERLAS